jgi:hypothetical protein
MESVILRGRALYRTINCGTSKTLNICEQLTFDKFYYKLRFSKTRY